MTFCVGWVRDNHVYLVADSAATSRGTPTSAVSSFGESEAGPNGLRVEEAAQKLIVLAPGVALGLSSNNIDLAAAMAGFLRDRLGEGIALDDGLDMLATSYGPFDATNATAFLIADCESGSARLVKWSTSAPVQVVADGPLTIGSLSYQFPLAALTFMISNYQGEQGAFVQTISAFLQMLGVHHDFVQQGVGGIFFGLTVTIAGVRWQEDTTYVLFAPDVANSSAAIFVSAMIRGGALVVASSAQPGTKVMAVRNFFPSDWFATWSEDLDHWRTRVDAKLWCFISRAYLRLVILEVAANARDLGFKVRRTSGGDMQVAFRSDFISLLTQIPVAPEPGGIPLKIDYRLGSDPSADWPATVLPV